MITRWLVVRSARVTDIIHSSRLDLILLSARLMEAIISGDREAAGRHGDFMLPNEFPDDGALEFLRFRRAQLVADASWAPWLARAIVRRDEHLLVGTVTFHGPPGINDMAVVDAAEVGYTIVPEQRNRGYATEAVRAMIGWAHEEHGVRHFVSAVAPDNASSLRVTYKLGFTSTGIVDDGELIFELWIGDRAKPDAFEHQ